MDGMERLIESRSISYSGNEITRSKGESVGARVCKARPGYQGQGGG